MLPLFDNFIFSNGFRINFLWSLSWRIRKCGLHLPIGGVYFSILDGGRLLDITKEDRCTALDLSSFIGIVRLALCDLVSKRGRMSLFGKLFGGTKRNEKLAVWGKSIPLTEPQRSVMHELWWASQEKKVPPVDPLLRLNDDDRAYLKKIASADFRPEVFNIGARTTSNALRLSSWRYFKDLGFTGEQAAILIGMMFNMVGRPDL